jgi:chloramphenicol O-acetyltransferase type A
MREIDLSTWPRREHFEVFNNWTYPHFSLCANVDLTTFRPAVKAHDVSLTVAIVYVLARAANDIPEFRYRIRGERVVEHDVVNPSTTILLDNDLFTFCSFTYHADFADFAPHAATQIDHIKTNPTLEDEPGQDDLLYMTAIPWVSFTSLMHPMNLTPVDSVPRLAWGKFFAEGDALKMPLSVQAHHALLDGLHLGRYYMRVQDYLNAPDSTLGL